MRVIKPDLQSIDSSIRMLGYNADTRRFLLTLLLTTRFHLTSRPISFANDSFFYDLAKFSDCLLEALRRGEWEPLDPILEAGIAEINYILNTSDGLDNQKEMSQRFGRLFRQYFRALNAPWSNLPPRDHITLEQWPRPDHIFFAVGPNIGIGDEMIFFRAARALRKMYPGAHFEVSSFHPTLWDSCDFIHHVEYQAGNPIIHYARARHLLKTNPNTLVVFVEFASPPIYRQLERVPGFDRFIYFDTGAQLVRMVDQTMPALMEHVIRNSRSIYDLLDQLLARIGCSAGVAPCMDTPVSQIRQGGTERARVFINPFSSKDLSGIEPSWWAHIVNSAAASFPIDAHIFCGINEQTRQYASEISNALNKERCAAYLHSYERTATIHETLCAAIACDAVLGLDTFTGHIGNLKRMPCVTVFLNSFWHSWRVPDPCIMNTSVHEDPERIGALLKHSLQPAASNEFGRLASRIHGQVQAIEKCIARSDLAGILRGLRRCQTLVNCMAKVEPKLEDTFADMPGSFFELLEQALTGLKPETEPSKSLKKLLQEAWKVWGESNLSLHIRFVSECVEMNRQKARPSSGEPKFHEDGQIAAGVAT